MQQVNVEDKIEISGHAIDKECIKKCLTKFKNIKDEQSPKIHFCAKHEITEVDISIIGHLILIKNEIPNIEILIEFQHESNVLAEFGGTIDTDNIIGRLGLYAAHALHTLGKSVYNIKYNGGFIGEQELRNNVKWLAISSKYMPIVFISKASKKSIFDSQDCLINFEDQLKKIKIIRGTGSKDYELYQAIRRALSLKLNPDNYIEVLASISYYKALSDAKLLCFSIYESLDDEVKSVLNIERKNDIRVGSLHYSETNKKNIQNGNSGKSEIDLYFKKVNPLFFELSSKPAIYHFIFSTLISSKNFSSNINYSSVSSVSDRLLELWEFTKELVYGLHELAKNIIQHSSQNVGVITGYTNNNEFELNIIDYGKEGILGTFVNSLKNSFPKNSWLEEDILKIENGSFMFSSFFNGNKILNQQSNRATAHLGILFFSRLINYNEGNLVVCSRNREKNNFDTYSNNDGIKTLPTVGTSYMAKLPLHKDKHYTPYKKITVPWVVKKNIEDENAFFNYRVIRNQHNIENDKDTIEILHISFDQINNTDDSFDDKLYKQIEEWKISIQQCPLVCVDFDFLSSINASQLFRFIGKWELDFPNIQLIVFNIKTRLLIDLKRIISFYHSTYPQLPFWNKNKMILCYSYEEIKKTNRFYFTDLIWGETDKDFWAINTLISCNNYNMFSLEKSVSEKPNLPANFLFDSNDNLISFDQLIEDKYSNTIFDTNSKVLLQNEIGGNTEEFFNEFSSDSIKKQIELLQKHKISETHFRLGSKIHISDFFYAKSFFQNSYNANKYAVSVAYYIIQEYFANNSSPIKELSLIGYGLYSELLVSSVKKLIQQKYFQNKRINYNTIDDSENIKLNNVSEKLYQNVIIIVPIATTFSTSLKIAEMLQAYDRKPKDLTILPIHINVLLVAHEEMNKEEGEVKSTLLRNFGWKTIDKKNKIIEVESYSDQQNIKQKYLISLETRWDRIQNCASCFPDGQKRDKLEFCCNFKSVSTELVNSCFNCKNKCASNERPLFATDKTSVTPELIFGLPKTRDITFQHKIEKKKILLTKESLSYGHFERNGNHYHYYFNDTDFWEINKDNVRKWLQKVKDNHFKNTEDNVGVVILAPGHFSNADFVHLVNDIVLENKATIIHYDTSIENTQNFAFFYGKSIHEARKIYFVDDTATSGATFLNANLFLKRILNTSENVKGFNGCFFFLNRTGFYEYEDIKRKLINLNGKTEIYSYADINLPYIKSFDRTCPLCSELYRYENLYRNSYLDRIKNLFLVQQQKLEKIQIPFKESVTKYKPQNTRVECRIEAIHRLYQWINNRRESLKEAWNEDFEIWIKDLFEVTDSPFDEVYLEYSFAKHKNCLLSDTSSAVLKVLTQPPFNNFIQIRINVFRWVIDLIDHKSDQIYNKKDIDFESFKEFKFLIRRASVLNSNYIISYKFFQVLEVIFNSPTLNIEEKEMIKYLDLDDFKTQPQNKKYSEWYAKVLKGIKKTTLAPKPDNQIDIPTFELSEQDIIKKETEKFYRNEISKLNLNKYESLGQIEVKKRLQSIADFPIYYVAQINELLHKNEARSIEIETRLLFIQSKSTLSPKLIHLLRMVREENGAIIRTFWAFFIQYMLRADEKTSLEIKGIKDFRGVDAFIEKNDGINKHYRYSLIVDFLRTNSGLKDDFFKFLFLKLYFYRDQKYYEEKRKTKEPGELLDKTRVIIEKLCEIVGENKDSFGSFMLVEYPTAKHESCLLAYNEGAYKDVIEEFWQTEENIYFKKFLKEGISPNENENISIVEFRNSPEGWLDLFSDLRFETGLSNKIIPLNSNLLLIRINKLELNERNGIIEDKSQGVIGFYYNVNEIKITDINKTRYLLLLKDDISKFIERHHESDEYRDWIEEKEKQEYKKIFWHGNDKLLEKLEDYKSEMSKSKKYEFDIILELLRNKFKFEDIEFGLEEEKTSFIICEDFTETESPVLAVGSIVSLIKDILSIGNFKLSKNINIEIPNNIRVNSIKLYITIVIFEIIYNAIKNAKESGKSDKQVLISLVAENGTLKFETSNTSSFHSKEDIDLINKNGFKKKGGGLELSKHFLDALRTNIPLVKYQNYIYTTTIIFNNILDNEKE